LIKQGRGVADKDGKAARSPQCPPLLNWVAANERNGKMPRRRDGTMAESSESGNGKGRKRMAAKTPARLAVAKVKSTIHLSVEASQRLDIHATMMNLDRSGLVEKLINEHLRRYVVSDRGGEGSAEGSAAA
jgi:hypothetical protein